MKCIRFTDDMALLAESETKINEMLENLSQSCVKYGMKIIIKKTKAMVIATKGTRVEVKIGSLKVEQVTTFRYLGCIINENMKCEQEIKTGIGIAKEAFRKKKNIFCGPLNRELRKKID